MKFDIDKEYTIGEVYRPAMEITDQQEADEFFKALVDYHVKRYGQSIEEATEIQKANLGYFAGYYDRETMMRVQRLFSCQHPIFGSVIPSVEEAFEMGKKFVKKERNEKKAGNI